MNPNFTRYRRGQNGGHYESFFLRANHPGEPRAFWIRYTIFSPNGAPERAMGELWAIYFDGLRNQHAAAKTEVPFADAEFRNDAFYARVGDAVLEPGRAVGKAERGDHRIGWSLDFDCKAESLFLLQSRQYDAGFPKAKSLVPAPGARFSGTIEVDGERIEVKDWIGSQNHNWGSRHTDKYAWGQVAGFDTHPDSFLEVATAQLKLGPFWTPPLTLLVLRHGGVEIRLNSIRQALRATGNVSYFDWSFASADAQYAVTGSITAPRSAFVGLAYPNPPGGTKYCLNSKIAACELTVTDRKSGNIDVLTTANRAAFEILTDDLSHAIPIHFGSSTGSAH